MTSDTPSIPRGYCAACGYSLHGLQRDTAGYRCPECGRAFDPDKPKTFCKRPPRWITRWLASSVQWPVVFLSLAAAVGIVSLSRWRFSTFVPSLFAPSLDDLLYYLEPAALHQVGKLVSWRDVIFAASLMAAIGAFCWWLLRRVAGWLVRWSTHVASDETPVRTGRRNALIGIASIISAGAATLGWPYRLARQWVARQLALGNVRLIWPSGYPSQRWVSPSLTRATLRVAVILSSQAQERLAGVKILMEGEPRQALPILTEAVTRETDPAVRDLELRLIGLHRNPETLDLLKQFLTHPAASTRAAAADAIGILHAPAYEVPLSWDGPMAPACPVGNMSVGLDRFLDWKKASPYRPSHLSMNVIPLDGGVRDQLERMMLAGASVEEREAAARALLTWPPQHYTLRVAEWGVWINDNGQLTLVQSVLDEIPAFVHRTGNPSSDFTDRVDTIQVLITKPIIHITAGQPLAVDVTVCINDGRPWFAYPLPDDFAIRVPHTINWFPPVASPLAPLDNSAIANLPDLRQGYPWLEPHHISEEWASRPRSQPAAPFFAPTNAPLIEGLGLRWQSVIVSPTRLPWMTLPEVGTDPRFAWWPRLRDVPGNWVSSRGESERFLYYDGPTRKPTPMLVTLTGDRLQLAAGPRPAPDPTDPRAAPRSDSSPRHALLIHHRDGRLSASEIPLPPRWNASNSPIEFTITDDDLLQDAVIARFQRMLETNGLSPEEAQGLIASWQGQFFQTAGTRLLLILSRFEYDDFCPIEIRPTPTELARVGIVLTEFN